MSFSGIADQTCDALALSLSSGACRVTELLLGGNGDTLACTQASAPNPPLPALRSPPNPPLPALRSPPSAPHPHHSHPSAPHPHHSPPSAPHPPLPTLRPLPLAPSTSPAARPSACLASSTCPTAHPATSLPPPASSPSVAPLSIRRPTGITSKGVTTLAAGLGALRALDLSANLRMDGTATVALAKALPSSSLHSLRLAGCKVDKKGCGRLAAALLSSPLSNLDLESNRFGNDGSDEVMSGIEPETRTPAPQCVQPHLLCLFLLSALFAALPPVLWHDPRLDPVVGSSRGY